MLQQNTVYRVVAAHSGLHRSDNIVITNVNRNGKCNIVVNGKFSRKAVTVKLGKVTPMLYL